MKYKAIISLCLLVFLSTKLDAQVPGYLGKKFALGYATTISSTLFRDINKSDGTSNSYTSISVRHNFELNFAIREKAFLAFNYSYQTWGVLSNLNENEELVPISSSVKNTMLNDLGVVDFKYINAFSNKFTLFYGFTKGIAPRGSYTAVGLSLERITPQITDINNKISNLEPVNNYGIAARFGKRRVFYDRFLFDLSANLELGFSLSDFGYYYSKDRNFMNKYEGGKTLEYEGISKRVKSQASTYSLISLRLGIYYLL